MTCTDLLDRVDDLVDGTLADGARDEVERHLAECDQCRALVTDLQRIRMTAAALERQPLPPGAWDRLVQRLDADGLPQGRGSAWRGLRSRWAAAAAAAALVLVVGWGVTQMLWHEPQQIVTTAGNPATDALVESIQTELQEAANHYERAIAGLQQVANATDSPLDPAVMATLKQSLSVIDTAIEESRLALRANPESQVAQENLLESFRRKIALLQDTIALMNEMRKGDEAGAARIVEGLNKS